MSKNNSDEFKLKAELSFWKINSVFHERRIQHVHIESKNSRYARYFLSYFFNLFYGKYKKRTIKSVLSEIWIFLNETIGTNRMPFIIIIIIFLKKYKL